MIRRLRSSDSQSTVATTARGARSSFGGFSKAAIFPRRRVCRAAGSCSDLFSTRTRWIALRPVAPFLPFSLRKFYKSRQQSISPGHSAELQSVTSVELPSQSWRPGWWQARALIFRPLPQELVHVDQSPHSCQPDGATTRISNGESVSI